MDIDTNTQEFADGQNVQLQPTSTLFTAEFINYNCTRFRGVFINQDVLLNVTVILHNPVLFMQMPFWEVCGTDMPDKLMNCNSIISAMINTDSSMQIFIDMIFALRRQHIILNNQWISVIIPQNCHHDFRNNGFSSTILCCTHLHHMDGITINKGDCKIFCQVEDIIKFNEDVGCEFEPIHDNPSIGELQVLLQC